MKKITINMFSFCLFISGIAFAQTVINVPADYATIQAAVNAASNNDIIKVSDGTYNESVNLATGPNGISIMAVNSGNATVDGGSSPSFLASGHTGNISISGFVLTTALNATTQGVINMNNLTGRLTVISNTISATDTHGIWLKNNTNIETNTSILNNSFGNFGNDDCIRIEIGENGVGGNANIVIDSNTNTGTLEDDAIEINHENSNSSTTLVITNNNFSNWIGTGDGIDLHLGSGSPAASNSEVHFKISDNTITNPDGNALIIDLDGINNTFLGTIANNTLVGDNLNTTNGMFIDGDSTSNGVNATITIENNTMSGLTDNGIYIRPFSDDVAVDTWNFVIKNNTIDNPNSDNLPADKSEAGILIDDSSGVDDENYIINVEITNNLITNLNGVTDCILIARPTTTTAGTAVINYEASGNSCVPTLIGSPTASVDPVPNTLDLLEIGNLVWHDMNGDGLKGSGEIGVEGVVISFTGNGFSGATTSDTNGKYTLPALTPGNYTLTAVPTLAFPDITLKNVGGNLTIDNDFDPTTKTVDVTLNVGDANNFDIDLGILDSSTLGIADAIFDDIYVYPNPVSNQFTFKSQLTDFRYSVYTIQGQLMISEKSNNKLLHLDFSNYAKGVYVLKITSKAKEYTHKIIKE